MQADALSWLASLAETHSCLKSSFLRALFAFFDSHLASVITSGIWTTGLSPNTRQLQRLVSRLIFEKHWLEN
jgi:hypothetical protein